MATTPTERPYRVAVVGPGNPSAEESRLAHALGRALGEAGAIVVCGGLDGAMAAAARGCREVGGHAIGLLPGRDDDGANPWIDIPIPTGMGEGRNVLVVRAAEAVVGVGGEWGTLAEIALACKIGRPVVLLAPPTVARLDLPSAGTPAEAAAWALEQAREHRKSRG